MKNIISQIGKPTANFPIWYSTPYYLTIEGGTGHGKKGQGGTYSFTGAYLSSNQNKHRIILNGFGISCLSAFCDRAGIKFWHANSMDELVEQMKDVELKDITTEDSEIWQKFIENEKLSKKRDIERQIKIADSYMQEIPKRKRAVRKDGNLRVDLQKEFDFYRFRKEQAERELKIYQPKLV